ncbi:MAG: zinc ribbon domain-containing protein [Thermoguttaceae bacterium]
MNLVGKIFIVLILVMSILFMGFAVAVYAAHTNWRDRVKNPDTGLEAKLKNEQLELERLTTQLTKIEQELATETRARQSQLGSLETEKELLTKERDQLNKDIATEKDQAREAIAAMKAAHETLAGLRKDVDTLRSNMLAALDTRDKAISNVIAKTDEANGLAVQMQTLQKQATLTSEQLANAMEVLRKFNLKGEPAVYADTPTKGVMGIVTALSGDLLQISLGEDDGLRVGHRLDAFRQSTYLGKIEVVKTQADQAVCRVLPEFRKGNIQVNDRVSTGLQSQ